MAGVRKLLGTETEKNRIPAYVASIACVDPQIGNEKDCEELPHIVLESISTEAIRLTMNDSQGEVAKKD